MGMSHDFEVAIEEGSTAYGSARRYSGPGQSAMTVGFHSPMPPAPTGIADYAAALYQAFRSLAKSAGAAEADTSSTIPAITIFIATFMHERCENPAWWFFTMRCFTIFSLGSLTEQQYIEEFIYNYGAWHRDLARDPCGKRGRSATDPRYFEFRC